MRAHFKQERAAAGLSLKASVDGDGKTEVLSESGIMASRTPSYLETRKAIAGCTNFLEGLDTMLGSKSKLWYAKATKHLANHKQITGGTEMETASKYVVD